MVQMRAINTPQFDSTRNRVSQRPQLMPPIFESEIAADGDRLRRGLELPGNQ
jgi:hypothetical protein